MRRVPSFKYVRFVDRKGRETIYRSMMLHVFHLNSVLRSPNWSSSFGFSRRL